MKRATENKFLIVNKGVVLTPRIERAIVVADKYFEEANHVAYVTAGLRDKDDQLRIIRGYLKSKGLEQAYPEAFLMMLIKK
jgi:hypothetical protein